LWSSDEKLLCGLLKELWAGSISGDKRSFVVHIILTLNSSSFQFYEAAAVVQELHLSGHLRIDDTPVSALVRVQICPTAFTSVGLREYVSAVGAVNGIFIIYCCKQVALESKSAVFFDVCASLLRNLY